MLENSNISTSDIVTESSNDIIKSFASLYSTNSSAAVYACPCERVVLKRYECLNAAPQLSVTGIELRWCIMSTATNTLYAGRLQSLLVTHGRKVGIRIQNGTAIYETFPTTQNNGVVRIYMGNGFGNLVKRGFRAIFHRTITVDGSLFVDGELQSLSLTFPVHSIRFLPILKGKSWKDPEDWSYWFVRCMFLFVCLATPCFLYWLATNLIWFVHAVSVWKMDKKLTLASIYNVPEPVQIPVADDEQSDDKNKQKEHEEVNEARDNNPMTRDDIISVDSAEESEFIA